MTDTNMNAPLDPMADQMKSEDEAVEETATPAVKADDAAGADEADDEVEETVDAPKAEEVSDETSNEEVA